MAIQTSASRRDHIHKIGQDQINEYDEEIDETEDDLIENYLYLTRRCGGLRHSPTTSVLDTMQQQQQQQQKKSQVMFARQYSLANERQRNEFGGSYHLSKSHTSLNGLNNCSQAENHTTISRVPPTIYYNVDSDYGDKPFSLVKLFARFKARLTHDRRYKPKSKHELLHEEDVQEWFELTKNIRNVLTKALLPDGGYDAMLQQNKTNHRRGSHRRSYECDPVLSKDVEDEEKIIFEIDDESNTEGDVEFDQVIWENFLKCSRGFTYRRCGVCKAIDRQHYQGQLVYIYGVANNILIDENLKASGLG